MKPIVIIAIVVVVFSISLSDTYAEEIPPWIKNTAGWWADDILSDAEFMQGIQFILEEEIIQLSPLVISELKEENKKKTYILPKEDKIEIRISENFPNYQNLDSLYVGIIQPDDSKVGLISEQIWGTDGAFNVNFEIFPHHNEGEYKIIGKSGGKEITLNSFLVKKQIISEVPSWIKNNAEWWANDLIDDKDFMQGIQFLIEERIIQIGPEILGTVPQICTAENIKTSCCIVGHTSNFSGICSDDTSIQSYESLIEQEKVSIIKLDDIRPRKTAENNWDRYKILEDLQAPGDLSDNIRMWYEKDNSLFQFYLYQFPTTLDAESYYQEFVSNLNLAYDEYAIKPVLFSVIPNNINQQCYEDIFGAPNYNPVGVRFDYLSGIVCISNNIVIHGIKQSDEQSTYAWHLDSMEQVLSKINRTLNNDSNEISIEVKDTDIGVSISDQIEGKSTSIDEGFSGLYCKQDGNWVELTGQYTNGPNPYSSIYFKLGVLDNQDRIVATGIGSISNVQPYQTKMFDANAEWSGLFKECIIEVDTAFP
jgi:hypothetical protein